MASNPVKLRKNSSSVALLIAIEKNKAHRNGAILFALVSLVLILWKDWNKWTLLLPAFFILYAILQHSNIILFNRELKQRASEKRTNENRENIDVNEGDNPKEDNPDSTDWIVNRIQQIEQKITGSLSETEKKSLREELSSLRSVLDARQAETEACVEGMRRELEKCLKKHIPTFQEWLTFNGNSELERTDTIVAYLDYLENRCEEKRT